MTISELNSLINSTKKMGGQKLPKKLTKAEKREFFAIKQEEEKKVEVQ